MAETMDTQQLWLTNNACLDPLACSLPNDKSLIGPILNPVNEDAS